MNSIIAERRIATALAKNISSAAGHVYAVGDEVLAFREKESSWTGPFKVVAIADKILTIQNTDGKYKKNCNVQQLKPFISKDRRPHADIKQNQAIHAILVKFMSEEAPRAPMYRAFITEIIKPGDPRTEKFDEAKREEIQGLIDRGTWRVVAKEEVSDNANILEGRFVLAIKDEGTDKEVWKERFVVQGYRDHLKTSLVHVTATSRQHSSRVLVGLAAIFGFNLFSTDATQAYLQSAEKLLRDVFSRPDQCSLTNSYVDDNSCWIMSSLPLQFYTISHRDIYIYNC
jgi:hypothetical protein